MSIENERVIRVGSRKSELALIQTNYVISILETKFPNNKYVIRTMTTVGDRVLNKSLPKIGEKSLFTKDLEEALTIGGVDFVVHSLKDLPTALPVGMAIGAILKREDPRDALVLKTKYHGKTLNTLPQGAVIGTSSLRRSAQLARSYKHLTVCDIRGNLNTRLAKLDAEKSQFDGIILAQAGLVRMGWDKRIDQVINPEEMLYAVGQGALAVECRSNDTFILSMLSSLCHLKTQCKILTERSFLKTLGGGCSAPVAVHSNLTQDHSIGDSTNFKLDIKGAVWSLDGSIHLEEELNCVLDIKSQNVEYILHDNENNTLDFIPPPKRSKIDNNNEVHIINEKLIQSNCSMTSSKTCIRLEENNSKNVKKSLKIDDTNSTSSLEHSIDEIINPSNERKDENENKEIFIECPLHLPIGQDVMGECPVLNTEQKVQLVNHINRMKEYSDTEKPVSTSKCPIENNQIITDCPHKLSNQKNDNKNDGITLKCPFSNNEILLTDIESLQNINTSQHPSLLLGKSKTQEYDIEENVCEKPTITDNSATLYCGMYCHKHINVELFEKCEELGKQLANNLINNGALDVMQCAQNEIRGKN